VTTSKVSDPVHKKNTHTTALITKTTDIHGGDKTSSADIKITRKKVRGKTAPVR
jgi:hypothetical protein